MIISSLVNPGDVPCMVYVDTCLKKKTSIKKPSAVVLCCLINVTLVIPCSNA